MSFMRIGDDKEIRCLGVKVKVDEKEQKKGTAPVRTKIRSASYENIDIRMFSEKN